jgi:hypothetical protein
VIRPGHRFITESRPLQIRKDLKITTFDPEWTLPSRMDKSPMAWLIQLNGMIMDVRRGMIPYIPGEQDTEQADE